jgi:hypothetical protein
MIFDDLREGRLHARPPVFGDWGWRRIVDQAHEM